ncbi:hypothetical protein CK203_031095 [Vitis vinifera]|uniref:Uncharacterized protein n=1 Tax=Vitis vinifera TaxID=29760 RepID=A0A438J0P8_VITVI|nr:hypothetical protein CK203_031095 [Vitis vinifera]
MEEEPNFGWIHGVVVRLCATLSLRCLLWRFLKRSGWRRCGTLQLKGGSWSPRFLRAFNDWEVVLVERLLLTIQGIRVSAEMEDRVIWKKTKSGFFTVKSLYSAEELGSTVQFSRKLIWSPYVSPRVGFFLLGKPHGGKF